MFGDGKDDAQLRADWHSFCDTLKDAGEILFRDTVPNNPVTRADGMRLLARNISLALQFELENADPAHPELMRYFHPLCKQGGDNTDALYVGSPVNGQDTYRVSGQRGDAHYFAVTVLEDGDTPWGGAVVGNLFGPDIQSDAKGNFEILLGPEKPADYTGNWITTTPDTWRLTFRQFFADWENEEPMTARIDRLTGDDAPPPELTAAEVGTGLQKSADWINESVRYWADSIDLWQKRPFEFLAWGEVESKDIDATPGGVPMITYWLAEPDEAIIMQVTPPADASYWALEFGNYWWETMDYRYRMSSTNCAHATLEDDGSVIAVISHVDTGLANWLDPSGHTEGYATFRWIGSAISPRPAIKRIKLKDLAHELPAAAQRVTPAQRSEQLRTRRAGICRRFRA